MFEMNSRKYGRQKRDDEIRELYKGMLSSIEMTEGLEDRIVDNRIVYRDRAKDCHSPVPLRFVSRRTFFAIAAMTSLAVGAFFLGRWTNAGARYAIALGVAQGTPGDDGSYLMSPDALGMVPVGISNGMLVLFRLNLCVTGNHITSLIYRIRIPSTEMTERDQISEVEFQEMRSVVDENGDTIRYEAIYDVDDASIGVPTTSFELDANLVPAAGTVESARGNPYLLVVHIPMEEFLSSDPLLELYAEYLSAQSYLEDSQDDPWNKHVAREKLAEAQNRYQQSLGDLYAEKDAFFSWMSSCYCACLELAGHVLSRSWIEVEAIFDDGSRTIRDYLIRPVENFSTAIKHRFEALIETRNIIQSNDGFLYDASGNRIEPYLDGAPFWSFVDGEPLYPSDDERLAVPLYRILDVTIDN